MENEWILRKMGVPPLVSGAGLPIKGFGLGLFWFFISESVATLNLPLQGEE